MIFVFGNGLSIGFDDRLTTPAITSRVIGSLGSDDTRVLQELAQLGTPEDPDVVPLEVDRGGFEQLAGPLDRLADALMAVQRLFTGPGSSELLAKLRDAAEGLRHHYVRIVGTVLREVDACCVMENADAPRHASWERMNAFAAELVRLRATMFTLNYDSLLMSALLQQGEYVYDGFRFDSLNVPLDRWDEPPRSTSCTGPSRGTGALTVLCISRRCRSFARRSASTLGRPEMWIVVSRQ